MAKLTLYYDVVSPWSYVAYELLKRYRAPWAVQLELKPAFLGGVMQASGNKPPLTVKNKGLWMNGVDLPFVARWAGITAKLPDKFPVNTIACMRFLRVLQDKESPETLEAATDCFYRAIWSQSAQASEAIKAENFGSILSSILAADRIKEYVELSQTPAYKDLVKNDAATLVDQGAFGFPWIIAQRNDGKTMPFFGSDRFELIAYFLGLKWQGPFPQRESKL